MEVNMFIPEALFSTSTLIPVILELPGMANPKPVAFRYCVLAENIETVADAELTLPSDNPALDGELKAIKPTLLSLANTVPFFAPLLVWHQAIPGKLNVIPSIMTKIGLFIDKGLVHGQKHTPWQKAIVSYALCHYQIMVNLT